MARRKESEREFSDRSFPSGLKRQFRAMRGGKGRSYVGKGKHQAPSSTAESSVEIVNPNKFYQTPDGTKVPGFRLPPGSLPVNLKEYQPPILKKVLFRLQSRFQG